MRVTDAQLKQWLYDAEYDWDDDDAWQKPTPSDTFPKYYSDDYAVTLAALFRELILRRSGKAIL